MVKPWDIRKHDPSRNWLMLGLRAEGLTGRQIGVVFGVTPSLANERALWARDTLRFRQWWESRHGADGDA